MKQCLVKHILPHSNCRNVKYRILVHRTVVTNIFTIWSIRLYVSSFIQIPFDNHFGIRRNSDVISHTFYEW